MSKIIDRVEATVEYVAFMEAKREFERTYLYDSYVTYSEDYAEAYESGNEFILYGTRC